MNKLVSLVQHLFGQNQSLNDTSPLSGPLEISDAPCPSYHSILDPLHFQHSLMVSIQVHFLRILLNAFPISSYLPFPNLSRVPLTHFLEALPCFFNKIGYVSTRFFKCSLSTIGFFFDCATFDLAAEDLELLQSLAKFFKSDVSLLYLRVHRPMYEVNLRTFSSVILGMSLNLKYRDFDFLMSSSDLYLPFLRFLHLYVDELSDSYTTGDECMSVLSESLKANSTIIELNLRSISIGNESVNALIEIITVNSTITKIDLSGNSLGGESLLLLAKALKSNFTINLIDLRDNCFVSDSEQLISESLRDRIEF
ncbi:hypothetical protein GEMRC1_001210 [Eukaryota sp. GEM-RC1]